MKSLFIIVSFLLLGPYFSYSQGYSAINGGDGGPTVNGKQGSSSSAIAAKLCSECLVSEQIYQRELKAYLHDAGGSYAKVEAAGKKITACYKSCVLNRKADAAYKQLEIQYNQAKARIEQEIEAASRKADVAEEKYNNAQPAHNKVLENEQAQNYNAIGKVVNSSTTKVDLESLEAEDAKLEQKKKPFEMENGVPFEGQNMDFPNAKGKKADDAKLNSKKKPFEMENTETSVAGQDLNFPGGKGNKQTSNTKAPLNKTIPDCDPCHENQQFIDLGDTYSFADGQIKLRSICVFEAPFEPSTQFVTVCGYNTTGKDLEIDITFVVHTTSGIDYRYTKHFSYAPYRADNRLNFGLSSPLSKIDGFDHNFTSQYGKIVSVKIEKFSYK